jgi:hypothetical protein
LIDRVGVYAFWHSYTRNLLYAMWHIEPDPKIVVSTKHNAGQHAHAKAKSGAGNGLTDFVASFVNLP